MSTCPDIHKTVHLRVVQGEFQIWNETESALLGTHPTRALAEAQIATLLNKSRHLLTRTIGAPAPEIYE